MAYIVKIKTIDDFCNIFGVKASHPFVGIIDFDSVLPFHTLLLNSSVYILYMHTKTDVIFRYGSRNCEKQDTCSMACTAPGQISGREDDGKLVSFDGWALAFHPDILRGKALEKEIRRYNFFDYEAIENLIMTKREYQKVERIILQIKEELAVRHDEEQDGILTDYISLILRYANRLYSRQYKTVRLPQTGVAEKFRTFLDSWYDNSAVSGVPTVQKCAEALCMSTNYFSSEIKRQTGETAGHYIREYMVSLAKEKLYAGKSVAEVADELGFQYPHHFSRLFKTHTGISPTDYVSLNKR